jgi:transketolase
MKGRTAEMALDKKELREVYTELLIETAKKDNRIVAVDADLMKATKAIPFRDQFPERAIDVGVAEANMIGVAAGLAAFGKVPFTHSFTPFATRRCYDQVAISVAYAGLNVKMVGSDPGVAAELNGGTHMSFEDVALMRNIPGMVVFEPTDSTQLRQAFPEIVRHYGPVYIRLYRKQAEKIYDDNYKFRWGKADTLVQGSDVTIITSGIMARTSLDAAEMLKEQGISARVINMHTIKPLDEAAVVSAARETGAIVTAENHSVINGLGSAVAEVICGQCPVPLRRIGVQDHFGEVGKMPFLNKKYKMTAEDIVKAVREVIKK